MAAFTAKIAVVTDNVFPVDQGFSKMHEKQGENHRSRLRPSARTLNMFRTSLKVKVDIDYFGLSIPAVRILHWKVATRFRIT